MIDAKVLLADLTRLLNEAEWQAAGGDADRTAETFEILGRPGHHPGRRALAAELRVPALHRRQRTGGPPLAGRHAAVRPLALARDRHEAYFREHPLQSDRDYLLACFRRPALPGLHTFFDEAHNPVFRLGISGDAAMALRSSGSRWTRTPGRWRTTSPTPPGTPASSATCTRT
jgi:hypothetical protein